MLAKSFSLLLQHNGTVDGDCAIVNRVNSTPGIVVLWSQFDLVNAYFYTSQCTLELVCSSPSFIDGGKYVFYPSLSNALFMNIRSLFAVYLNSRNSVLSSALDIFVAKTDDASTWNQLVRLTQVTGVDSVYDVDMCLDASGTTLGIVFNFNQSEVRAMVVLIDNITTSNLSGVFLPNQSTLDSRVAIAEPIIAHAQNSFIAVWQGSLVDSPQIFFSTYDMVALTWSPRTPFGIPYLSYNSTYSFASIASDYSFGRMWMVTYLSNFQGNYRVLSQGLFSPSPPFDFILFFF